MLVHWLHLFQMEKQFGTFKKSTDETVAMLEELFARSKSLDELDGEDSAGLSDRDGGEGEDGRGGDDIWGFCMLVTKALALARGGNPC